MRDTYQQQELLATHRTALHHLLKQQAQFGVHTPEHIAIGIGQRRAEIARIKAVLRGGDVAVDDHPDDGNTINPAANDTVYNVCDPALIATFYGQRGMVQPLADHLAQQFQLVQERTTTFTNDDTMTLLLHFDTSGAADTSVIQLVLNSSEETVIAWRYLRVQIEAALDEALLHWPVWGYTLVYQAMLEQSPTPSSPLHQELQPTLNALLPVVHGLQPDEAVPVPTLAVSTIPGGLLSLHHLPLYEDGLEAATVYTALSLHDPANQLVRQVLIDTGALLLMPDLVAHKSYHQMRQYRGGGWLESYNQHVEVLRDITRQMFSTTVTAEQRATLERAANEVTARVQDLKALHLSLTQQQENFPWWVDQLSDDKAVMQVHQQHIDTALRDLALLIEKGQAAVNGARMI